MKFSASSLFANALSGHKKWPEQFPNKEPKKQYDVVIVGAGGHGLGAAYYLAKKYGITQYRPSLKKVGLAAVIRRAIQPLFGLTISMMKARLFMTMR